MREHGIALPERDAAPSPAGRARIVATYDYQDETGVLAYQVQRLEPKTFRQRRPDPSAPDGWVYSVKGQRLLPYRLPELVEAIALGHLLYIVEGEKDVEALRMRGIPATCNPMGAGKWRDELNDYFAGADVVIIPDNDDAGRKHRDLVAGKLAGIAHRIRTLDLPGLEPKGDVSDWLDAGGSAEELYHLVDTAALKPGEEPFRSAYGAVFFADLDAAPVQRNWIVKGVLEDSEFSTLWGFSGSGKSFLILDMGLSIALAAIPGRPERPWFGHRVFPGGVIYLAPEGGRGLANLRIRAWRQERNVAPGTPLPFVLVPAPIDLRSPEGDTGKLIAEMKQLAARMSVRLRLVIVDTLAQAMAGGNENASEDMGAFIRNCQLIHQETGAHVVAVHHAGLDRTRERGHTSLRAACETSIEVLKPEGGGNAWVIRKQKDGEEGVPHPFRLQSVKLGVDEDGDAITSCVVVPSETGDERTGLGQVRKAARLTDNAKAALRALRDALNEAGEPAPPGLPLPHGLEVVRYARWRTKLEHYLFEPDEDPKTDKARQAIKRVGTELLSKRVIGRHDPYVWIVREPSA